MDVNGTRYHLLYGRDDWGTTLLGDETGPALVDLWRANAHPPAEWDDGSASLRLARQAPLFRRAGRMPPFDLATRRGAGRDKYGNWYWIDPAETGIRFLPNGAYQSKAFWTAADLVARCTPDADGNFATACVPPETPALLLCGLAVTAHHYLVAGDVNGHGLLIFDLHRGGPPLRLLWPADVPFTPWDIAAAPGGGVLILDRDHLTYWALDASFRLPGTTPAGQPADFQPIAGGGERNGIQGPARPEGYALVSGSPPEPLSPVSIEPGPDGHVLILDTDPGRAYSIIYEYQGADLLATYSLENAVEAADPASPDGGTSLYSVAGHDFAFVPAAAAAQADTGIRYCAPPPVKAAPPPVDASDPALEQPVPGQPPKVPMIYVADREGKQALAFAVDHANGRLVDLRDFYPLRRWQARALVTPLDSSAVYYDFADRWVPLQALVQCEYAAEAVLVTPAAFPAGVPGGPFDGGDPGCVWHRLFLDALIPPGTAIQVRARAADDPDALLVAAWLDQPTPYLRSGGAELPFFDPWADVNPLPEGAGTWELLFQKARGRYLQLEITLSGNRRATPGLRALRAWYPRFSYPEHYLPAIYREEPVSASFLDRALANFEGFYTDLEGKIEHIAELFDARTAPADALDWLACWFGVALDPLWTEERRRFFIRHADQLFRLRGTLAGVQIALQLYLSDTVSERLFDRACWDDGRVRIVERFLVRGIGGLAYGDPTETGERPLRPLTVADVAANAHRFTVLVPANLSDDQQAMVDRIVRLEKPAHTAFDLKRYWDLFRVGEARLGLDTRLGDSHAFGPLEIGAGYLPEVYLQPPYPFDVDDRIVSDRDRLGDLPQL